MVRATRARGGAFGAIFRLGLGVLFRQGLGDTSLNIRGWRGSRELWLSERLGQGQRRGRRGVRGAFGARLSGRSELGGQVSDLGLL